MNHSLLFYSICSINRKNTLNELGMQKSPTFMEISLNSTDLLLIKLLLLSFQFNTLCSLVIALGVIWVWPHIILISPFYGSWSRDHCFQDSLIMTWWWLLTSNLVNCWICQIMRNWRQFGKKVSKSYAPSQIHWLTVIELPVRRLTVSNCYWASLCFSSSSCHTIRCLGVTKYYNWCMERKAVYETIFLLYHSSESYKERISVVDWHQKKFFTCQKHGKK